VFLFNSLLIIQFWVVFFYLLGRAPICPGSYAGLSQGWLWEYNMPLICSRVGLLNVSKTGLELTSANAGTFSIFSV
jgi:hypothetical protein